MSDTATLDLFAAAGPDPVRLRELRRQTATRCASDRSKPQGVGHNSVCICHCAACRYERGAA